MALAFTELTTVNSDVTGSVSPAAGSVIYCLCASAYTTGGAVTHSPTGCATSWTLVGQVSYGSRRGLALYRGNGTFTAEAIDIGHAGAGTWQESITTIIQITGFDTGTPNDAGVTDAVGTGTSLNSPDVGTPGTGDAVLGVFAFESTGDSFATDFASKFTLTDSGAGGNVRQLQGGYDASGTPDETPGSTWTTTGNACAVVACIINVAAAVGGNGLLLLNQANAC